MTNREWLLKKMQNMSDKELAVIISVTTNICNEQKSKGLCGGRFCRECKLEWLKQEHQEHKEEIKLSEAERVILENLDEKYKWIARDKDNELYVYEKKPLKTDTDAWSNATAPTLYESLSAFNHLFEFVKWEDEEPYNIEELLESEDED